MVRLQKFLLKVSKNFGPETVEFPKCESAIQKKILESPGAKLNRNLPRLSSFLDILENTVRSLLAEVAENSNRTF